MLVRDRGRDLVAERRVGAVLGTLLSCTSVVADLADHHESFLAFVINGEGGDAAGLELRRGPLGTPLQILGVVVLAS